MENKVNMFGKVYTTIGSSDSNFIIKTKGDLKILWGNKFIDLIKDGNISTGNSEESGLFKIVNSKDEVSGTGIFINPKTSESWVSVENTSIALNGDNYVSFLLKLEKDSKSKDVALTNIGFYYDTIEEVNSAKITSGLVYVKNEKCLYIIDSGKVSKYDITNSLNILQLLSIGDIHISGIGTISAKSLLQLNIGEDNYLELSGNNIFVNKNIKLFDSGYFLSKSATKDYGFRLYNLNSESTLEVDNIVWRNLDALLNNYIDNLTIFSKNSNIIHSVLPNMDVAEPQLEDSNISIQCQLKYKNTFLEGDEIYILYRDSEVFLLLLTAYEPLETGYKISIYTSDLSNVLLDVILEITYNDDKIKEVTFSKDTNSVSFEDTTIETILINSLTIKEGGYEGLITGDIKSIITKTRLLKYLILEVLEDYVDRIIISVPKDDYDLFIKKAINNYIYKANSNLLTIEYNTINVIQNNSKQTIIGELKESEIQSILENDQISPTVGICSNNIIGINPILYNPIFNKTINGQYPKYSESLQCPKEDIINTIYNQSVPNIEWVKLLLDLLIPQGTIVMWNGDSIPEGWALCDGTKGTPNLIGRFIKASNVSGDIGGGGNVIEDEEITNKVMLTENNIPKHKHPIPKLETSLNGKHSHTYIKQKALLNSDTPTISINNITFKEGSDENFEINVEPININESTESLDTNLIEDHLHIIESTETLENDVTLEPFSIDPKYYSLIFIMKISNLSEEI